MRLRSLSIDQGNEGYVVWCVAIDLPAIFDEMWFLTNGNYTRDLRKVFE